MAQQPEGVVQSRVTRVGRKFRRSKSGINQTAPYLSGRLVGIVECPGNIVWECNKIPECIGDDDG